MTRGPMLAARVFAHVTTIIAMKFFFFIAQTRPRRARCVASVPQGAGQVAIAFWSWDATVSRRGRLACITSLCGACANVRELTRRRGTWDKVLCVIVQTCSVHNYRILLHRNRHRYRRIPSRLAGNTSSHHPIPRISPSRSSSPSQCRNRPLAHWPFTPLPHPACMHACKCPSLPYPARGNPPARPRRLQAPPQFPLRHHVNRQKNAEMSMSSRQRMLVYRI
jgi:hypothetical protein